MVDEANVYVFADRAKDSKGRKALSLLFFLSLFVRLCFFFFHSQKGWNEWENTSKQDRGTIRDCEGIECGCVWVRVWVHACTLNLIDTLPRLSFLTSLRTTGMSRRGRKKKGLLSRVRT